MSERTEGREIRKGPLVFGLALLLFACWISFLLFWAGRLDRALHRPGGAAAGAGAPAAPAIRARLTGITLSSPDPARLRDWYVAVLGLDVVGDGGADRVVLDARGVRLEIVPGRARGFLSEAGPGTREGLAAITLEVPDLEAARARLRDDIDPTAEAGVTGMPDVLARDPDGNLVRLVAPRAAAAPPRAIDP